MIIIIKIKGEGKKKLIIIIITIIIIQFIISIKSFNNDNKCTNLHKHININKY